MGAFVKVFEGHCRFFRFKGVYGLYFWDGSALQELKFLSHVHATTYSQHRHGGRNAWLVEGSNVQVAAGNKVFPFVDLI